MTGLCKQSAGQIDRQALQEALHKALKGQPVIVVQMRTAMRFEAACKEMSYCKYELQSSSCGDSFKGVFVKKEVK